MYFSASRCFRATDLRPNYFIFASLLSQHKCLLFKNSYSARESHFSSRMDGFRQIRPPASVRGMTKWDRNAFKDKFKVPAIICSKENINIVRKLIQKYMIKVRKITPVVDLNVDSALKDTHRQILLDPSKLSEFDSLPQDVKHNLKDCDIDESAITQVEIVTSYQNWTFSEVVRAIVPEEIEETSSGFSEIGHIAHFNLREEMLPFKFVVGEALLDYSNRIKTVVNKTNQIDNTYRTFQLELLAGEENYITQIKESNCVFEMDFSKVYWNSRLGTEHRRVIDQTYCGDVVFDVFAGIGPFAVPCAKKKTTVFANDLNPVSYQYLVKNREKNKLTEERLKAYCLDGREFTKTIVRDELSKLYKEGSIYCDYKVHIVMNLPAIAVTFVDAFKSLLKSEDISVESKHLPKVYCYCFTDLQEATKYWEGDMEREIKERVRKHLPELCLDNISLRFVRNVAPNKDMMCINFTLSNEILFGPLNKGDDSEEPLRKCQKLEDEN